MKLENKQRACFLFITVLFCIFLNMFNNSYDVQYETPPEVIESTTRAIETTTEITTHETTEQEIITKQVASDQNGLGWFWCTSYCSCPICCGSYSYNRPIDENGNEIVIGASGMELVPGYSVAVDPRIIPYGTIIIIDGQEYVAADTGISGYRLDFYCSSHEEALSNGNKWAEVYLK